jgi:hypothetical protein
VSAGSLVVGRWAAAAQLIKEYEEVQMQEFSDNTTLCLRTVSFQFHSLYKSTLSVVNTRS